MLFYFSQIRLPLLSITYLWKEAGAWFLPERNTPQEYTVIL